MQLDQIGASGTTPARQKFWDSVRDVVTSLQKKAGTNVSVLETPGQGTLINASWDRGTGARGACCVDGECSITTAAACEEAGGNYLGDGTTCDGVDCTQGACCDGEDCTITTEEECTGTYQGDGTTCDPNPCPPFDCGSELFLGCVGIMCDTSGETTYTSVFDLSPGFFTPESHLSGSEGPSDFATLDWTCDIVLDGMGGYTLTFAGTVTGRYGSTQSFSYDLTGTCGVLNNARHTDRFCCEGSGHCSDILGCTDANCLLAFDSGEGFGVTMQLS